MDEMNGRPANTVGNYCGQRRAGPLALEAVGIALALLLIVACGGAGPPTYQTTVAADLQALGTHLDLAIGALNRGDLRTARREYQGFDQGWDKIEDGIKARSRDSYRSIERAMDDVKVALLQAENPDSASALGALRKLDETIKTALPGLH